MRMSLKKFVAAGVLAAVAAGPVILAHLPGRALAQPAPAAAGGTAGSSSSSRDLGAPGLSLKLAAGPHRIAGVYRWTEIPQRIPVPQSIGVLTLTLKKKNVSQARRITVH